MSMKNFDAQLLRLKQALGVSSDQEVAAALGLTKAAFSDRKRRDAFPEEKLYALAAKRPDLHLDVLYVLVGDKKDAVLKLTIAELEAASAFDEDRSGSVAERPKRAAQVVESLHAPLPEDEQVLLDSYRRCGAQARQHLIQTAALLAAGMPPAPAPAPRASAKGGGGQSVVGDNAIQIGSVAGKARVKNR